MSKGSGKAREDHYSFVHFEIYLLIFGKMSIPEGYMTFSDHFDQNLKVFFALATGNPEYFVVLHRVGVFAP